MTDDKINNLREFILNETFFLNFYSILNINSIKNSNLRILETTIKILRDLSKCSSTSDIVSRQALFIMIINEIKYFFLVKRQIQKHYGNGLMSVENNYCIALIKNDDLSFEEPFCKSILSFFENNQLYYEKIPLDLKENLKNEKNKEILNFMQNLIKISDKTHKEVQKDSTKLIDNYKIFWKKNSINLKDLEIFLDQLIENFRFNNEDEASFFKLMNYDWNLSDLYFLNLSTVNLAFKNNFIDANSLKTYLSFKSNFSNLKEKYNLELELSKELTEDQKHFFKSQISKNTYKINKLENSNINETKKGKKSSVNLGTKILLKIEKSLYFPNYIFILYPHKYTIKLKDSVNVEEDLNFLLLDIKKIKVIYKILEKSNLHEVKINKASIKDDVSKNYLKSSNLFKIIKDKKHVEITYKFSKNIIFN